MIPLRIMVFPFYFHETDFKADKKYRWKDYGKIWLCTFKGRLFFLENPFNQDGYT